MALSNIKVNKNTIKTQGEGSGFGLARIQTIFTL